MDGQEQIVSIGIDIISAIRTNDLAKMKIALNELEAFHIQYGHIGSVEAIPFSELAETYNNEAFQYLIKNCTLFIPNLEYTKLMYYFKKCLTLTDDEINQLLKNELKEKNNFKNLQDSFFYELLFRLAMHVKNYDVLTSLKTKMEG